MSGVALTYTYLENPVRLFFRNHSRDTAMMRSTEAEIAKPVVKIHYKCTVSDQTSQCQFAKWNAQQHGGGKLPKCDNAASRRLSLFPTCSVSSAPMTIWRIPGLTKRTNYV